MIAERTGVASISAPFVFDNLAGNLIIAFVRMSTNWQTVSITDTAGNVYTDAVWQSQDVDGHQIHLFYAKNIAPGRNVVTATFSSTNNYPWLAIYEYSGPEHGQSAGPNCARAGAPTSGVFRNT
ncbi:MAG: hypothetical protein HYX72_04560 [Acidobacteria bacterium]|nr:hypothetical protein [Acidobacteriota bacterium]